MITPAEGRCDLTRDGAGALLEHGSCAPSDHPASSAPARQRFRRRPRTVGPSISYSRANQAQDVLVELRRRGDLPDALWVLEHRPVITFGTRGGRDHLLLSPEEVARRGFDLEETRRGGDVTCHEPGQLVGYPIVALESESERDLHDYLRRIEDALIDALATWRIAGRRVEGRTGVWVGDGARPRKIAAIGVRCSRWVTSHGFALNVANSLEGFELIVPCGIRDAGVTSVAKELAPGDAPSLDTAARAAHSALERSLGRSLELLTGEEGLHRAGLAAD